MILITVVWYGFRIVFRFEKATLVFSMNTPKVLNQFKSPKYVNHVCIYYDKQVQALGVSGQVHTGIDYWYTNCGGLDPFLHKFCSIIASLRLRLVLFLSPFIPEISDLGLNWVRLAPNGTHPDFSRAEMY